MDTGTGLFKCSRSPGWQELNRGARFGVPFCSIDRYFALRRGVVGIARGRLRGTIFRGFVMATVRGAGMPIVGHFFFFSALFGAAYVGSGGTSAHFILSVF
jgi:hypothetical protein